MELLLPMILLVNVLNFIMQTRLMRDFEKLEQRLKRTSEIQTMALSKTIKILDSHTATIEDISATCSENNQALTSLLKNAAIQTKSHKQLLENTK